MNTCPQSSLHYLVGVPTNPTSSSKWGATCIQCKLASRGIGRMSGSLRAAL
jgi:hypothetical protein